MFGGEEQGTKMRQRRHPSRVQPWRSRATGALAGAALAKGLAGRLDAWTRRLRYNGAGWAAARVAYAGVSGRGALTAAREGEGGEQKARRDQPPQTVRSFEELRGGGLRARG